MLFAKNVYFGTDKPEGNIFLLLYVIHWNRIICTDWFINQTVLTHWFHSLSIKLTRLSSSPSLFANKFYLRAIIKRQSWNLCNLEVPKESNINISVFSTRTCFHRIPFQWSRRDKQKLPEKLRRGRKDLQIGIVRDSSTLLSFSFPAPSEDPKKKFRRGERVKEESQTKGHLKNDVWNSIQWAFKEMKR